MNQTPNYQLNQWEAEDKVLRTDFNADNEKIDVALNAQAGTLASHTAKLATHTAQIAKCGNCRLYYQTYNGESGNKARVFTFPSKPLVVIIYNPIRPDTLLLTYGMYACYGSRDSFVRDIQWSGNTLTIPYSEAVNRENTTYQLFALLDMNG